VRRPSLRRVVPRILRFASCLGVLVAAVAPAAAAVYRCEGEGGGSFSARVQSESVWLKLPNHPPVLLRAVPAGSGGKYGDGPIVFWSKGERASVYVGEAERYIDCLPGTEHPWRNRYTAREAGVRLQLPEAWNEGEFTMRTLGGEAARGRWPGALHVITAEFRPAGGPPATLATVLVYPRKQWLALSKEPGPAPTLLAETDARVYALALPQANPYPPLTVTAQRFDELRRDDTYWWGALSLLTAEEIAQRRVVRGTVASRQRIALSPGSVVEVSVQDISRADAPARRLGTQRITLKSGQQVPIAFEVAVDPDAIEPGHLYSAAARIYDPQGRLRFVNDTTYRVFAGPSQDPVAMNLVPVVR
jgi:putative lipoprotein